MHGGTINPRFTPESFIDFNLRFVTALSPEREIIFFFSEVVWIIRNSVSSRDYVLGGSEIRNPVLWEIRISESSPAFFAGSEILNHLLCFMGDQTF